MAGNLPTQTIKRASDNDVRQFFDKYFTKSINYPTNEVNAVISFFEKRGFDKEAAISVASVLLLQAKIDNVKIFKVLDTLEGLDEVKLSAVVAEVLNYNRSKTSSVGYKRQDTVDKLERRNITK
jgi:hypothetical protein